MSTIHELEEKYDPDNDTMPGLPDVTWGDYQLLQLIKKLEKRIAKLEADKANNERLNDLVERGKAMRDL